MTIDQIKAQHSLDDIARQIRGMSGSNSIMESKTPNLLFSQIDPFLAIGYATTIPGSPVKRIVGLGNNPDVDQATVPEDIWPGGGLYPWITAAATSLEAVSTSTEDSPTGTGMGAISLSLLDGSYNEITMPVTLNGVTAAPITGTYKRINGGLTTVKGSGAPAVRASNVGDIIIRDSGGGTTRAIIPAAKGIMRQAVYTVPAGYTAQVVSLYMAFNRGTGGGATRYLTIASFVQNAVTGVARTALDISCNGESYRHDGLPGIILPEKTDFALQILSVSADNSDITGAFLGVLISNAYIATLTY